MDNPEKKPTHTRPWISYPLIVIVYHTKRKGEIWLSPMTKTPSPIQKSKKQSVNTKTTENFDYTTIVDRFRVVSWGNDSHPTGVAKPVYGITTFPLTAKAL